MKHAPLIIVSLIKLSYFGKNYFFDLIFSGPKLNNDYQISTLSSVMTWLHYTIQNSRFNITIPVTKDKVKSKINLVAGNFKYGFQFGGQIGQFEDDKSKQH